jgi:hypothetical protein
VRNGNVVPFRVIGDRKVSDIIVAGPLACRGFPIELHLDGAFIVLIEGGIVDWAALRFHEELNM